MQYGAALLQDLRRLLTDDGFACSILAVVAAATMLAFGFGATSEIVTSMLVVGVATAFAEHRMRARK